MEKSFITNSFDQNYFDSITQNSEKARYLINLAEANNIILIRHAADHLVYSDRDVNFENFVDICKNGEYYFDSNNENNFCIYKDGVYLTLYRDKTGGISSIIIANNNFPSDRWIKTIKSNYLRI